MANTPIALLPATTITTAVTAVTTDPYVFGPRTPDGLAAHAIFAWGSGGTTAKFWLQTSFDGGTTWVDIINFAFAVAILSKVAAVSSHIVAVHATPTDGTLADNTIINGLLGDRIRVKYTTTGTYAGGTTIAIWVALQGVRR